MKKQDTIAAIATGIGNAGIGIIRISGEDAIVVADKIFKGKDSLMEMESHRVVYGHIIDTFHNDSGERYADRAIDGNSDGQGVGDVFENSLAEQYASGTVGGASDGKNVDEVLVTVFRAPRSYTREDVVEISSHGGAYVMQRILSLVYQAGARAAEPGEFTKRAFLNGRIDLSQAESVMDIIASDNERMLANSLRQLDGALSSKIRRLRDGILHETAYIEAALDDPEHYDLSASRIPFPDTNGVNMEVPLNVDSEKKARTEMNELYNDEIISDYGKELLYKISMWKKQISALSATAEEGRILREGLRTVIVGRPNVGKSSLLNMLAREDRAIVTDVPGTTRDTIEEKVRLSDLVLAITDTAGIRRTDDLVERIGVEKSVEKLGEADLILFLVDVSEPLTEEDFYIADKVDMDKTILIGNKVDLVRMDADEESQTNDSREAFAEKWVDKRGKTIQRTLFSKKEENEPPFIFLSTKNRDGVEQLTDEIRRKCYTENVDNSVDIFVTNARHVRLLRVSEESLSYVEKSIMDGMPEDFWTADLMDAYSSLGEIIGEEVEDDLVEKVFADFCMGK